MTRPHALLSPCLAGLLALAGCGGDHGKPTSPSDVWDIDRDGIPRFVATDYVDLARIHEISRFRSSSGHDYSDAFEHCRSMKHYFEPRADTDWSTIPITAPIAGTITRVDVEWAGTKLEIIAADRPAFRISIFHVQPTQAFAVGDAVAEGQPLGTHVGSQTMSDVAVLVNDPTRQGRMVSWFDVITDEVWQAYAARGVAARSDLVIPKAERDANPLTCSGDVFVSVDTLPVWVVLE
jgi:hypothetical protein